MVPLGFRILVLAAGVVPLAWLAWQAGAGGLGANPIEAATRFLGDWALRLLLAALAFSPLQALTGWEGLPRCRKKMGLFAFAYVCLHLASYVVLDQFFDWRAIAQDILKRRYITVGMMAFTLLLPLALTSMNLLAVKLGSARWRKLHKLVYPAAILAIVHFAMLTKGNPVEPIGFGLVLCLLMGWRLIGAAVQITR